MGGPGSGNWYRRAKKSTVERSLEIGLHDFPVRDRSPWTGTFTWVWTNGHKVSIAYTLTCTDGLRCVTLRYVTGRGENVRVQIRFASTPTQFGGKRWWLVCPLMVHDVACRRRVSKLYLPPGGEHFGCRTCHGLTYQSSQEAHKFERLTLRLGEIERRLFGIR